MRRQYPLLFFLLVILLWSTVGLNAASVNFSMNVGVTGELEASKIKLNNGTTGAVIYNYSNTSANITINYISGIHDHILNISDVYSQNLKIKLQIVRVINLTNLNVTCIYFKTSSGVLIDQLNIENKSITQAAGNYLQINASENIPLVVEENSFDSGISSQIEMKLTVKEMGNNILYEYRIFLDFT